MSLKLNLLFLDLISLSVYVDDSIIQQSSKVRDNNNNNTFLFFYLIYLFYCKIIHISEIWYTT